jgi:zinc protease
MIDVTLLPQPRGRKPQALTRPADAARARQSEDEPVNLDNRVVLERVERKAAEKGPEERAMRVDPIRRLVLPNGLRVLIQRSTVVPAVAMQFYQLGGLLSDAPGHEGVTNAAAQMLLRGTEKRSAERIAQQIEDLGAEVGTEAGNNTAFVRAACLKQDWAAVLDLVADVTLHPSFPEDEWARVRPRLGAAIARQNDEWSGELRNRFRLEYFGDAYPWSQPPAGRAAVVDALKTGDLAEHYRRHLGASQAVLSIFGDVDPDQVAQKA